MKIEDCIFENVYIPRTFSTVRTVTIIAGENEMISVTIFFC